MDGIPNLVIAGRVSGSLYELRRKLKLDKNIFFVGFVDKLALINLYNAALFFVSASIRETFGLTPIEALSCGCPVVISDIKTHGEVVGDSALYFDPYDVLDIARKMFIMLTDDDIRLEIAKRGLKLVNKYDWQKTSKQYVALYETLLKH